MGRVSKEFMKCPTCCSLVDGDASACRFCGAPLTKKELRKRQLNSVASWALVLFNLLVIAVMVWANFQTREMIKTQQTDLGLQRDALVRTDSALALTRRQTDLLREANDINRLLSQTALATNLTEKAQLQEEYRPKVVISKSDASIEGSFTRTFLTILNDGKSRASNIMVTALWRDMRGNDLESYKDTLDSMEGNGALVWNTIAKTQDTLRLQVVLEWTWETVRSRDSMTYEWLIHCHGTSDKCPMYRR